MQFAARHEESYDYRRGGRMPSGEITGNVFEWHPGGEVTAVEGTELSGANGIEIDNGSGATIKLTNSKVDVNSGALEVQ